MRASLRAGDDLAACISIRGRPLSLFLLGIAMKSFELGTAYAIWVGVGVVGTTLLGIVLLGEGVSAAKLASVALIIAGITGLKLGMVS